MKKLLLLLVLLFTQMLMFAQPVDIYRQFNGRLDFTAIGNTLNEFPNNGPMGNCTLLPSSSATLNLTSGQTFVSAHLYWGSVGTGDFDVELNGIPVTAQRTFAHTFNGNPYFAAYTEVTNIVAAAGNGSYTFSELDVSSVIGNYCGTDFGGWAIYIIYSDPSLRLNQISLFDGLESVSAGNQNLDITLTNIDVTSDILSKIGFLAWEGEAELANMESLLINGILIDNPPLNPGDNAFNGTNTYTGSSVNYNMDLDFYDLVGIVQPGDVSVDIRLTSAQDFVMVNNIITSVNSELSDATIVIDRVAVLCDNNDMTIDYTVHNINSTAPLALNTPIAFYADAVLIGQAQTLADIPIGGSESGQITVNIPLATPNIFNLRAVVDDIGNGTGVVAETDETNNEFIEVIDLSMAGLVLNPGPACIGNAVVLDSGLTDPPFNIQWYIGAVPVPIPGATNPTLNVTTNGIYSVTGVDGICRVTSNQVSITFNPQPVANPPVDLFQCDDGTTSGVFDLTVNDPNILGAQNPALFNIKYYETLVDSQNDTNPILGPTVHLIVPPSPQTIFVRIEDLSGSCFDLESFEIYFSRAIAGLVPAVVSLCDDDQDGSELIDLELEFNSLILDGEPSSNYNITYHTSQADADGDVNPLPNPYLVTAPNEIIYIRLENRDDSSCFDTTQNVNIIIDTLPVINNMPPTMILCDPNNDGFAEFDLTMQTPIITMGDPTLSVTYHGTLIDAENNALALPNPYINDDIYLDVPITDTLDPLYGTGGVWARVQSTVSSCYEIVPFALEVRFAPVATTPAEPLRMCDDATPDGFTFFDLTVVAPEVLGTLDPTQFDLYYYEDLGDATTAGDLALTAPDYSQAIPDPTNFLNSTNPQDIYILVVGNSTSIIPPNPNSAEGCYDIVTLTLIVDPNPIDLGPFEMMLCDDDLQGSTLVDEISTFDLTTQNALVNGGDPTITVLWYETPGDELADNPIPNPTMYQNLATPQTIIGRAESEFGCRTLVTLTLTVLPNPDPKTDPTPLEVCDDDDDGIVTGFDLTLRDVEIIDGQADVSVLYYEDRADAEAGIPGTEIPAAPYRNIVPFSQIVFARVFNDVPPAALECYTIVELELIVIALPDMPDPALFDDPFIGCDESGNGVAIFDLTLQNPGVLGSQNGADFAPITYYETFGDAQAGLPGTEINPDTAFISSGQPIWVRLESLITGCVRVTEFQIEVGIFPTIGTGDDLFKCDDEIGGSTLDDGLSTFDLTVNDALITLGDDSIEVFYYETLAAQAANTPIATPEAYQNIIPTQQQIFVSGYSTQGCSATSTFYVNVNPNPDVFDPGPFVVCDMDNNGFAEFDLDSKIEEIRIGDPLVNITFHLTRAHADADAEPLVSPYTNVIPGIQTIFVRAEFEETNPPPSNTGCFRVFEMDLIVRPTPIVPEIIDPILICDVDGNGVETFDLTQRTGDIVGLQMDVTLTFHESLPDAQAGTPLIMTPGAYMNITSPQTIHVRLEDNATGCFTLGTFIIEAVPGPAVTMPTPYSKCDDLGEPNDGITSFNLTTKNNEITGGVPGIDVGYYETLMDAQMDTNRIDPDNDYENLTNPQTLFVRVTDGNTQCFDTTITLELQVVDNPTPVTPDPFVVCDENNPGDLTEVFNLTDRAAQILNGNIWGLSYHESYENAQANIAPIPDPTAYSNITSPQIIYVRATDNFLPEGCFEIVELELIVNPLPDNSAELEDLSFCETPPNGEAVFNLEVQIPAILNGQDPSIFEVSFYTSQADADAMMNPIPNPTAYTNITNPQEIFVGILNNVTLCYASSISIDDPFSFFIEELEGALATQPIEPYVICDNDGDNDGIGLFTLISDPNNPTELDAQSDSFIAEILNGQNPDSFEVSFHLSLENAENNVDPLPNIYENIINPQLVYVRVTHVVNGCYATTEIILKVEELADVVLDEEYRICLDAAGNMIAEEEGDPSPPVIDTGLDPSLYAFVWDINGEVQFGQIGASITAFIGGVYTVTVTELESGCSTMVSTTVIESSPPIEYSAEVINGAFAASHSIQATATGLGTYAFQLDNGEFNADGLFEDVDPGPHLVTIKDVNGCGSVTIEVGVVDYPRFVTPNQDGYHDTWNIIGIAEADPAAKIYIFDKYGKLLKQISPLGQGWDGTYNGNPLPSTDYWFLVEYTEQDTAKSFRGHFTLKR